MLIRFKWIVRITSNKLIVLECNALPTIHNVTTGSTKSFWTLTFADFIPLAAILTDTTVLELDVGFSLIFIKDPDGWILYVVLVNDWNQRYKKGLQIVCLYNYIIIKSICRPMHRLCVYWLLFMICDILITIKKFSCQVQESVYFFGDGEFLFGSPLCIVCTRQKTIFYRPSSSFPSDPTY